MRKEIRKKINEQMETIVRGVPLYSFESDDVLETFYAIDVFPTSKIKERIGDFVDGVAGLDEDQFYYDLDKMHVTILGGINLNVGEELLIRTAKDFIEGRNLTFELSGLAMGNGGASFVAYPSKFDLEGLRRKLRVALGVDSEKYTKFLNVYEKVGWMYFMRFTNRPRKKLIKFLLENRGFELGSLSFEGLRIVKSTSKTLSDDYSVIYAYK